MASVKFGILVFFVAICCKRGNLMRLEGAASENITAQDELQINASKVTMNCAKGYSGTNCENLAYCTSYPCLNGGTCIEETNGYNCTCAPGYTGNNCEMTLSECSSSPCLNGGTCRDGQNSYSCICSERFTGTSCETAVLLYNSCQSQPCQNSGTCIDKIDGYTCSCTEDYTGVNCQNVYCQFYITETSSIGSSIGGFISKMDEGGDVIRLTTSGSSQEFGVAAHGTLIFYTTYTSKQVWRVSSDNPCSTRVAIWTTTQSSYISGLGIGKTTERVFVDIGGVDTIQMIDYRGSAIATVVVTGASGYYRQLAVDEANGVLYFADDTADSIYAVAFISTGFSGPASMILSSAAVGDGPTGLVYEPQDGKIYWILRDTHEIRSAVAGSPSNSELMVPADSTSGDAFGLAMCAGNFYYTSYTVPYGIWRASRGNSTKVKVTTVPTLSTYAITRP